MSAFDFSKPFKAALANADQTVAPWTLLSTLSAAASNLLGPLAGVSGWAFVICLATTVTLFFLAARSPASDPGTNPLRLYGNGLVIAVVLGLGFCGIWTWQQLAGNPPRGVLVAKVPELEAVQRLLTGTNTDIHALRTSTASIETGVEKLNKNVKRETSEDPRKELANTGQPWTAESFLNAIERGDRKSIDLYLVGGMRPDVRTDQSVLFYAIGHDAPDLPWTLKRFVEMGLNLDQPMYLDAGSYPLYPNARWKTPIYIAAVYKKFDTLRVLAQLGANTKPMIQEFTALISKIDADEAEKMRMQDRRYCIAKILREQPKDIANMAQQLCAVDMEACADTIDPGRGYRHTASTWCEKIVSKALQSPSLDWGPANPARRQIYAQALDALGRDRGHVPAPQ